MKRKHVLYLAGAVLLVAFGGFSLMAFQESLTPYVSYRQAQEAGRTVQVAGALVKASSDYDLADENLRFTLRDEASGETLRVRYAGLKPANFEDAISIVAIGRWDAGGGEFAADKLLVKCPSKYQGAEVKEYS